MKARITRAEEPVPSTCPPADREGPHHRLRRPAEDEDGAGLQPCAVVDGINLGRWPRLVWGAPMALVQGRNTRAHRPVFRRIGRVRAIDRGVRRIRRAKGPELYQPGPTAQVSGLQRFRRAEGPHHRSRRPADQEGQGPGGTLACRLAPGVRDSIPDMAFIVCDTVFREESTVFLLERAGPVVFFLAVDVVEERRKV